MKNLAEKVRAADRSAVARALTVVERRGKDANDLLRELWSSTGRAFRIGVTGSPGVGKSTLVDGLASALRTRFRGVGIIAVDPTSPFTHGALLGDRIRMQRTAAFDDVFVRSMASRGRAGGLSPATSDAADVFDAAGYEVVLVETVGVGQGELDVAFETDIVLIVTAPGLGDGVQALKAGIMEAGDLYVVNKCDLPGADAQRLEIEDALMLAARERKPKVLAADALGGIGIREIADEIVALANAMKTSGELDERRRRSYETRLVVGVRTEAVSRAMDAARIRHDLVEAVAARRIGMVDAAEELWRIVKEAGK